MAFDARKLRIWFATGAVLVLLALVGFYSYARYRVNRTLTKIPEKIGVEFSQTTTGFTFSKTEAGRTLFTLSAGKAVQFKEGQRFALNDVRIVVFGRGTGEGNTYDQIFGRQFNYDPKTGDVTAQGEVSIDIQAEGKPDPDPLKSPSGSIHLSTSDLTFNRNTGIAQTNEALEFAIPQAKGSAKGAVYDSNEMTLTLKQDVRLTSVETAKAKSITMNAGSAVIAEQSGEAIFQAVKLSQANKQMSAEKVVLKLRDDNSIEKITASGGVNARAEGKSNVDLRAALAEFNLGAKSELQNATMSGNVSLNSKGAQQFSANSGKVQLTFGRDNAITKARALDNATLQQVADGRTSQIKAQTIDFFFGANNRVSRAETSGASELQLSQTDGSKTIVNAAKFNAAFDAQNRIRSVQGTDQVKVVASAPNAPDRVTTSRTVTAQFDAGRSGGIQTITQEGDFKYAEGQRTGSAERAQYSASSEVLTFTGSPRVDDKTSGLSISAETLRLNRKSGEITAERNVKTTYVDTKASAGGAMFSGSDPIHATGSAMTASRDGGTARFSGGSRLWQGANIIQAPVIVFKRTNRTLLAEGGRVQTVFVQTDRAGKVTPIQVAAQKLEYSDGTRRARFSGGVTTKGAEATVNANQVDIILRQRSGASGQASQVQEVVAEGKLTIEQQSPVRRAKGERLVYTPADGKFVLTGNSADPPSIFDAELGDLTADSLTFFSHDDRVQVMSGSSTRTVTRTRIKNESRP